MRTPRSLNRWHRIDTYSHRRPIRWLLPRRIRNLICDAFDRSLGVFDD